MIRPGLCSENLLVPVRYCAIIDFRSTGSDIRKEVIIMRQEQFKMERQGLVEAGQTIKITERVNGSLYSYVAEPSVAMSGIYRTTQRIKAKEGIIQEIRETDRGFYLIIEFEE